MIIGPYIKGSLIVYLDSFLKILNKKIRINIDVILSDIRVPNINDIG